VGQTELGPVGPQWEPVVSPQPGPVGPPKTPTPLPLIMATTYDNTSCAHDFGVLDVNARAKLSPWSAPSSTKGMLSKCFTKFLAFCCCHGGEWDDMQYESECRDEIRRNMQRNTALRAGDLRDVKPQHREIETVAVGVFNATGYDLMNFRSTITEDRARIAAAVESELECEVADSNGELPDHLKPEELPRTTRERLDNEFRNALDRRGITENALLHPEHATTKMVPRFTAAMVVSLRATFGRMPANEANRLLIEREYLRVCREGNVRQIDTVAHAQWVYNAYFNEGIMEEIPTTRIRVPRWLRGAFGEAPSAPAVVC